MRARPRDGRLGLGRDGSGVAVGSAPGCLGCGGCRLVRRKAELLELVASERGPESASAASVAVAARARAARLVGQNAKCQDSAGVCSAVPMRSAA